MLKFTTKIILSLSFLGILNAASEDFKDIKTVKESSRKKEAPSWTCPICGKTFEKPEVHYCYEIKSDGTIVRP